MNFRRYLSRVLTVVFLAALWCAPSSALAQDSGEDPEEQTESSDDGAEQEEKNGVGEDGYVTPTEKQTALNTSAVEAIKNEEYDQAVKLLRRSLELGDMNITYLNLGRAHQRLEECGAAEAAYLEALSAPPVRNPSPFLIEKKVEQYLQELENECDESDWEKTTSGESGSGNYTWDSEPQENAPMMRLGVGVAAAGYSGLVSSGTYVTDDGDVSFLGYRGTAVRIEAVGGYFVNNNVAIHAGLIADLIPSPSRNANFRGDLLNEPDLSDEPAPNGVGMAGLVLGATGYIPGDVFLSGSVGFGFGGIDDPYVPITTEVGWALNVLLGKDFQINDQFAFGIGTNFDVISLPTAQGPRFVGLALGLQTHGTIRFR